MSRSKRPAARAGARSRIPVSTYRLQLHRGFNFRDLSALVPYLHDLGVTDCYVSPFLLARQGSLHGYDVCDHGRLNPELGSDEDYEALADTLSRRGMGQILDFVPNHMVVDPLVNPWWRDVLENGPSSPYADFFDIDWEPVKPELRDRVLLPILGDQYGAVLERGELQLEFVDGALVLQYGDARLPINPRQSPRVFRPGLERLEAELGADDPDLREFLSVLTALHNLPVYTERVPARIAERQREKEVARERLAELVRRSKSVSGWIEQAVRRANGTPGEAGTFDLLHELLEAQAYRLAYWRTAFDEINYRRFFDINELAGLRMEDPRVFDLTHRLVVRLVSEGKVTGLRIDHPDGLFDPQAYFARLQEAGAAARPSDSVEPSALYVVVEKILSAAEELPDGWAVDGTTGYDFLNTVNGVFIDAANVRSLRRIYARFTGHREPAADHVYISKKRIMLSSMASELNVLAHALNRISECDRSTRDFTLNSLRKALMEVVACFPVYRTYVTRTSLTDTDARVVDQALAEARRRNPVLEPSIFAFIRRNLLPDPDGVETGTDGAASGPDTDRRIFAMKFQQYTSPVQAKGLEDTAFYRYAVLISANEVGGDPERIGRSVEEFHDENLRRLARWPHGLLATATHDTKRGEDARARINVLSEMPDEWRHAVARWTRANASLRTTVFGEPAPDRNDEYFFYQALVGAWPAEPLDAPVPVRAPADLVDRMREYMRKALKEAKVHSSWLNEAPPYEEAVDGFVERSLAGPTAQRFLASFVPFVRRVSRAGMINSLAQLALKLGSPGVPDFYQGAELWDLSLVDPDNRRPVDFDMRRAWLAEMAPLLRAVEDEGSPDTGVSAEIGAMLEGWQDGRVKLLMTALGLRLRRQHPGLFLSGRYVPLAADEGGETHLVAFAREHEGTVLIVIVPRSTTRLAASGSDFPLGLSAWKAARVLLPAELADRQYRHAITGEIISPVSADGHRFILAGHALARFPVAWLWAQPEGRL